MSRYHVAALLERQKAGENLHFLFFYGHRGTGIGPHVLSQWWEAPFEVSGVTYPTAEHWMMSKKADHFWDKEALQKIRSTRDPAAVKKIGREVKGFVASEWDDYADSYVLSGNVAKFRSNPELKEYLLSTGTRTLVEASPYDRIWGIGRSINDPDIQYVSTWNGQNRLGEALMKARDELRSTP